MVFIILSFAYSLLNNAERCDCSDESTIFISERERERVKRNDSFSLVILFDQTKNSSRLLT